MRAALLLEPGKIVIDEVADPRPGADEVRIAVGGVGLCGSDQSVFSGKWDVPHYPWIMGHEAFGVIDAVGAGVSPERVGEMVVVEPNVACFACEACRRGWTSGCTGRQSLGMNRPGALAERLVVSSRFAWKAPPVPDTDLVCIEPATVAQAALRRLRAPRPDSALVIGAGAQGLTMSLALLNDGVATYIHDISRHRVEFATELGARPVPVGASFGLVVDTVGSPSSTTEALQRVEGGGSILCLGLDDQRLDITSQSLVRSQISLQGSLTYDHPDDFASTISLVASGRLAPGRIVTDEYPLEETQIAFERSGSARGKTWISIASPN